MAAKLDKTNVPGIFRRHREGCPRTGRCECSYVIVYLAHGRQRTEPHRTLAEAREAKRTSESAVASGEYQERARVTLHEYAREWVDRYQGTGRRGFREETRDEYRRLLDAYALKYFPPGLRLSELTPDGRGLHRVARRAPSRRRGTLSDKGIRNALGPLSACLATARREGLIRHNPAADATLPNRPRVTHDDDRPRPFPRVGKMETMELVVALVHPDHRLMFTLLAATGMRRSELLALEGQHLALDGERPFVRVRQRVRRRKGHGLVLGPLKSRYARRDLPISVDLADRLRSRETAPNALVFASNAGTLLDPDNLHDRVLSPACEEAGVEWAGFHTFRHTVASRLFAAGRNVVQVQRWLGHHSPSFTLDTYVHLLDEDLAAPLKPLRVNSGSTERPETAAKAPNDASAETVA